MNGMGFHGMRNRFGRGILISVIAAGLVVALAFAGWRAWRPGASAVSGHPSKTAFRNAAREAGLQFRMRFLPSEQGITFRINLYDHGCGLAVGDYNSDGHDDLYLLNQLGSNALFRNRGDGTFENVTSEAGVALDDRVCVSATFADYDNDGWQDLFVTTTRGGNVLFRNSGKGAFENVTRQAGLEFVGHSQSAVFFDVDNDGLLDLFVANTAEWTTDTLNPAGYYEGKGLGTLDRVMHSEKEFNVLYHNNGNGTFSNHTSRADLMGRGWAGDAVGFDYDEDGDLDLFVTCMFGRAQLFRNNGFGPFTDVTLNVLGPTPWGGLGAKLLDFNNDGRLDLYVVDMHSDMWMGLDLDHASLEQVKESEKHRFPYLNGPRAEADPKVASEEQELGRQIGFRHHEVLFGNALYRNEGAGRFTECALESGLETFWPWGIATGDFNNDGWEDVFVPAGMGYPFYYWPNSLLMNQGDGTFLDRATEMGVEPPLGGPYLQDRIEGKPAARSSRCAATADFDGDGRLEIVVNNFNDAPYFFQNRSPKRNYAAFRLRGTRSNRDAIGAVVRVFQGTHVMTRMVQGESGYLAQSSRTLHFGLGDQTAVERVEIQWPSGQRQVLADVGVNTIHEITEPDKAE